MQMSFRNIHGTLVAASIGGTTIGVQRQGVGVKASDRIGPVLGKKNFETHLHSVFGVGAEIVSIVPIGEQANDEDLKQYGYGAPIKVTYRLGGHGRHAVFETLPTRGVCRA